LFGHHAIEEPCLEPTPGRHLAALQWATLRQIRRPWWIWRDCIEAAPLVFGQTFHGQTMKDVPVFTSKMTVEPDTHNPHNKPVIIMKITNSNWQIVKTYEPQD